VNTLSTDIPQIAVDLPILLPFSSPDKRKPTRGISVHRGPVLKDAGLAFIEAAYCSDRIVEASIASLDQRSPIVRRQTFAAIVDSTAPAGPHGRRPRQGPALFLGRAGGKDWTLVVRRLMPSATRSLEANAGGRERDGLVWRRRWRNRYALSARSGQPDSFTAPVMVAVPVASWPHRVPPFRPPRTCPYRKLHSTGA
jgi:hypothetical protein